MYDQMKEDAICQPPDAATTQRTDFSKSLKYNKKRKKEESHKLPHRYPRSVRKHPSGNVHRGQLLEQKLGGVRDVNLWDTVLVVAETALEETLLQFAVNLLAGLFRKSDKMS